MKNKKLNSILYGGFTIFLLSFLFLIFFLYGKVQHQSQTIDEMYVVLSDTREEHSRELAKYADLKQTLCDAGIDRFCNLGSVLRISSCNRTCKPLFDGEYCVDPDCGDFESISCNWTRIYGIDGIYTIAFGDNGDCTTK